MFCPPERFFVLHKDVTSSIEMFFAPLFAPRRCYIKMLCPPEICFVLNNDVISSIKMFCPPEICFVLHKSSITMFCPPEICLVLHNDVISSMKMFCPPEICFVLHLVIQLSLRDPVDRGSRIMQKLSEVQGYLAFRCSAQATPMAGGG